MTSRRHTTAILASVLLFAACSSGPASQATSLPATPSPSSAPVTAAPESAAPATAEPTPTPSPTVQPPPVVTISTAPPKPGNPTFHLDGETKNATGTITEQYTVTWTSPEGVASEFLVYGLKDCLRYSKKYNGKPCVVHGMTIPKASQVLLATVRGDARSATFSWDTGEAGPPPYYTILVRAANTYGNSTFTIVHSENVCYACTY